MNLPDEAEMPTTPLHYHVRDASGLFQPIAFGFVTERMRDEILVERELILRLTPASRRAGQEALFARYDPRRSADVFRSLLSLFLCERRDPRAA